MITIQSSTTTKKNKKQNTELLGKRLESVNFIYFEEYGSLLDENSRLRSKV